MNNETVVLTSGYFDPIHPGHISCFKEAKKLGDKLIVIVDGDNRAIKKKGKPFIPAQDRLEIVKAIKYVDAAYIENIDVKESLKKFKPDIFAKGGDRTDATNIPEWELCEELGIKIVTGVGFNHNKGSRDYLKEWVDFVNQNEVIK